MMETRSWRGGAARLGLMGLAVVVLSSSATAQNRPTFLTGGGGNDKIQPDLIFRTGPAFTDSTTRFFPQVNETVGQKRIMPTHRGIDLPGGGSTDSSGLGSADGDSEANTDARFPGMNFSGSWPPDPDIAVGPDHVVQVVNGGVAIFKKDGTKVFQQRDTNSGFWGGMGAGGFIFDPKCAYDPISKRFYVLELDVGFSAETSHYLLAISDDSDPTGSWHKYRIENEYSSGSDYWVDYPSLAFNRDAIVLAGNLFGYSGGASGTYVHVLEKAPLLSGSSGQVSTFHRPEFTMKFGKQQDASTDVLYAATMNSRSSMGIYAIENLTTTPVMSVTSVAVPFNEFAPGRAPQPGASNGVDTIAFRLMSAYQRGQNYLTCHTTGANGRSQVTWYEIDMGSWPTSGTPTYKQGGNVALQNNEWAYQPSIASNSLGDISMTFSRSSSSINADMMVASRKVGDAAGQMGAPVLMASSQFQNSGSVSRWGDYSDVEVDPTDDATFWGVVEMNGSNQWTTEIQSWEVTKPVNSVPRLQPLTVSQLIGTHVGGGGVAKLYDADQDTYDVRSERVGRAGQIAGVITTYNTVLPGADITQFIVDFSATMAFGRRVSATVFLWDYDAGEWVFGKAFSIRRNLISDYTYEVTNNIDRFVSDTGDIKVLVRSHEAQSRWFGGPRTHYIQLDKVLVGVVD